MNDTDPANATDSPAVGARVDRGVRPSVPADDDAAGWKALANRWAAEYGERACCCVLADDEIVSPCMAHIEWRSAAVVAERERCAHLSGELQALRNHVDHWSRAGIDGDALARADAALRERA